MAQTIQIKRGGFSGLGSLSLAAGEMALVTGSIANIDSLNRFITINDGTNTLLPAGAVLTGSTNPNISSYSELNGALFYNSTDKQLVRLDAGGNQNLDIAATVENGLTAGNGIFYNGAGGGTFDGSSALTISIDSASIAINDLNGTLSVANGGTGVSSLTDHGVLVGSGTDPITALAVGNAGQLLIGQTGADPSFTTVSGVITIDNTGVTAFTSTANSLISGAFASTSASIAANIATNTSNISTNAGNITTLTAQTSSYLQAADLSGYVNKTGTPVDNQLAIFTDADTVEGSANLTFDGTHLAIGGAGEVRFRDTALLIRSSQDGQLDAVADTKLNLQAPGVDIGNISTTTATTVNIGNSNNSATVNIKGNLNVAGTTTTVNSTIVNIDDNIIVLNYGGSETDGGIHVTDGPNTGSLLWDGTNNYWKGGALGSEKRVILEGASAGTANTVVKFDAAGTVINSTITDNGNDISLGGNVAITSGHTLTAPNAVTFSGLTGATNNTSAQVAFVASDGKLGEVSISVDASATATGFLAYSSDNVLEFVSTIDGGTF